MYVHKGNISIGPFANAIPWQGFHSILVFFTKKNQLVKVRVNQLKYKLPTIN
jgi:hypothetical protein